MSKIFSLAASVGLLFGVSAFGGMVQKEGLGIEEKTVLLPSLDKPAFPKMEGWLRDLNLAEKLARESGKSLLIGFLGSDWCPWSLRLAADALSTADFVNGIKEDLVLVWLDFPENELLYGEEEKNTAIKKKYNVYELPTLVLADPSGEEIAKMGYSPDRPQEFAAALKKTVQGYHELKDKLEGSNLAALSGDLLKELYLKARSLGCNQFKEQILDAGVAADEGSFFLLEKYTRFVESGKRKDKQARLIREKIVHLDPQNKLGSQRQLAFLDFQSNLSVSEKEENPKMAIKPLVQYIKKYGKKDVDNLWKIEMMIAQYLYGKKNTEEALKHAEASYSSAPDTAKPEIKQSIEYLQAHLSPSYE